MSNDPKLRLELRKLEQILDSLKFGNADSPRVRGGQSAVHGTCSPEALQRNSQLQKYTADGLPKDRGRSACVGQYLPEAISVGRRCENSKADGPLGYRGQSANGQKKRRILTAELIMNYKGISLVDHIHLGAYEMFELDIYARVACYKMFEWINCLVFKIELI